MQLLYSDLIGSKVYALVESQFVGIVKDLIFDKETMVAQIFTLGLGTNKKVAYLLASDIKDINSQRFFIQSSNKLSDRDDLIRYRAFFDQPNLLLNRTVKTESRIKLGKCWNFCIEFGNFNLSKIYVKSGILKNLWQQQLIIDRSDILRVTDSAIIVRDNFAKVTKKIKNALPAQTP